MMSIQELAFHRTSLGDLSLLRREAPSAGGAKVYEVRLAGEFLMSSLINESEVALAQLPLSELEGKKCHVLVGGLGLGYTAKAALDFQNVQSVTVVEYLPEVIEWHRRGLVPLARNLTGNPRCRIVQGDFFRMIKSDKSDPSDLSEEFDAILVDIDHSPEQPLHPSHAAFYEVDGLRQLAGRIRPGGVFALWSADPFDDSFLARMKSVFPAVRVEEIRFFNPHVNQDDSNFILIASLCSATTSS